MNTEKVRLNITLPLSIAKELYQHSEPRKRSSFIAEAIKFRILQIKQEKTKKFLAEGYKETKNESLEITKEFESIDIENWDEY
ncbi:MAG: hypothetical protein PHG14_03990 [Desulfobacter postgatei]|jgi:uncharacterized Zn finger protein|uniref:Uncharacterized protein n=1 Tax=Desulfobacter postgatei 2ac9 TaxID=879212 RepID=I5B2T6_9BACT|nr:hypothetical protein [Desulfobacter postgatei]EIM63799.1 hypothetical protein DespoDRAFT_01893 [Desulfobacter postgatei 2ac9]MDD4272872.1 hypothetical protein [Desulfobacter postgatei]MDX9962622.1 hypothetical protein [Desulfobacter postgatei]